MKYLKSIFPVLIFIFVVQAICSPVKGQSKTAAQVYFIYAGNTHAHTAYTESHGANLQHLAGFDTFMRIDSNHVSRAVNSEPKPDGQKLQGPPSVHFALAKKFGYDFYVTTDHSQEAGFHPTSANNPQWIATLKQAADAADKNFVALAGVEHSENDGPGGKGHINVINAASYLNALEPGVNIQRLYQWLDTVSSQDGGPVVATFNHPGPAQYDNWKYRDEKVTDIITMLEVINSNNKIHYQGFLKALDNGWKVSPVAGNDNHGTVAIGKQQSRTFVLATAKTKAAILDAMKNRRTYASLDKNLQCRYTVNEAIMGSTLKSAQRYQFVISVKNPDTNDEKNKITKIDIVTNGGEVVKTYEPTTGFEAEWKPVIENTTARYFFVRIWTAGGGDAPGADPSKPVAWLAPVWTSMN